MTISLSQKTILNPEYLSIKHNQTEQLEDWKKRNVEAMQVMEKSTREVGSKPQGAADGRGHD